MKAWLGSIQKVDPSTLSPIKKTIPANYVLGVLGTRSKMTYDAMRTEIIQPALDTWGLPAELIIPSEGESSHVLMLWAQQKDIPIRMVSCDWVSDGRRATLFRDTSIQREAHRLIVLQGPRSNAASKVAARLAKKGKPVGLSERPGFPLKMI